MQILYQYQLMGKTNAENMMEQAKIFWIPVPVSEST